MKRLILIILLLAAPALAQDDNATWTGCVAMSPGCLEVDGNCTCLEWDKKAGRFEGYSLEFLGPIDCCDEDEAQDCMDCPKQMGRLFHKDGVFYFEGDMDASAELFLEFVNERAPEFSANG